MHVFKIILMNVRVQNMERIKIWKLTGTIQA